MTIQPTPMHNPSPFVRAGLLSLACTCATRPPSP